MNALAISAAAIQQAATAPTPANAALPFDSEGLQPKRCYVTTDALCTIRLGNFPLTGDTTTDLLLHPAAPVVLWTLGYTLLAVDSLSGVATVQISPLND